MQRPEDSEFPLEWEAYGIQGRVAWGDPKRARPWKSAIDRKTAEAVRLIERFIGETGGKVYVSMSFGKDSLTAWYLCRHLGVPAVWVNQGPLAEWPDCLAVKNLLVADGMRLTELTPDSTIYQWYLDHGVEPSLRMSSKDDRDCNEALIFAPFRRYNEATGQRGFIWGLRGRNEAAHRRKILGKMGLIYTRADGMTVCSPVGWWTTEEIWAYIDLNGLPYPAMYDLDRQHMRNGSPICVSTAGLGKIGEMRCLFPEIYRVCVLHFPELARMA